MAEQLYINGTLIKLTEKSVAYTLQVNDISEVKDRNASYTNNIKILKTPENVLALEMLATTGNITAIQYNSVTVKYIVDGVELISSGQGLLKNSNEFYNLIVYDGNIVLTELLGKATLSELDWSAHDHSLTEAIYTSSWSNTSGYIYPLGAFYTLDSLANNSPFIIDVSTPMMFLHTLVDMIFNQQNHTVTGAIFTDQEYKDRVISMDRGYLRTTTNTQNQVFFRSTSADAEIDESETYTAPATGFEEYIKGTYVVATQGSHRIQCLGFLSIVYGINAKIVVKVNNIVRNTIDAIHNQTFDFITEINLDANDTVEITVRMTAQEFGGDNKIKFSTFFNIFIDKNTYSIPINFDEIIGDTLQIDFVKDMMQHFGLIFRKLKNETVFNFIQIKALLIDRAGADNWSSKYISVPDEQYKPPYARKNHLKYLYDDIGDANVEQTYADGVILIDNNRLNEEKTLFTSIYKAGVSDNNYFRHSHWIDNEGVVTINQDGIRMYKIIKVTDIVKYRFSLVGQGWSNITGTTAKLIFIDYQADVNSYYLEFKKLIEAWKNTLIVVNLSVVDVYDLDFFKLKFFEQLGAYYYLNKVMNFKKGRNTTVQLIKVGADVIAGITAGASSYAGSSDYDGAVLTKNTFGSMIGSYAGSSDYDGATLRKNDVSIFSIAINSQIDSELACAESQLEDNWHNGSEKFPEVNDTVYTDSGGTSKKNGSNFYWKMETTHSLRIDANGLVTSKTACP